MVTRLYFVRHAEAEGNVKRIFHGWTDAKLTEKGRIQAQKLAARMKDMDIDVIYSSSLERAKETAAYIAAAKNLPVISNDNLREINGGSWENQKWEDLPLKWPYEYHTWENRPHIHNMPDGESMEDFQERLISEIKYIIDNNMGKNVCIVTHGTAIKALICYFTGCSLEEMLNINWVDNTSITEIHYEDGTFKVVDEGDSSHLGDEYSTLKFQDWWEYNKIMIEKRNRIISLMFETGALQVCPEDSPFWYTSGTIGPYYINTHYLYGSKEKAEMLLKDIEIATKDRLTCSGEILAKVLKNYNEELIYKELIDELCDYIKSKINIDKVDYISGGERRDWFFSLIAARILKKPHLTIFKDLDVVVFDGEKSWRTDNINGASVLHIADLITEASSYIRAWIPAVKSINGVMKWSVVIVDRNQGGEEMLLREKIISHGMVYINKGLFDKALSFGLINEKQYNLIIEYLENPRESMRKFLIQNPEFIEKAMKSDKRTRERAELCIEKDIYGLGERKS
ncbi:MAG TPA: histidine phosphatase family protein [Clostridiaceae bacterium]|nr:histidine phosphatase family protein [Clostridiaceae bacterium]